MAEPWEYWPTAQKIQRKQKAPDILQDLIKNTNLDTNTINDLVKSYVDEGKTRLPNMVQEGTQGPLEADQSRETPRNSLRNPVYTTQEGSTVFQRAPEGVSEANQIKELNVPRLSTEKPMGSATFYTRGQNGYEIVGREPSMSDRWIDVTENGGGVGSRGGESPQSKVDRATIAKVQEAQRQAGAKGVPVSGELLKQGVESAQRLGLPTYSTPVEEDVPGAMGAIQRFLPGGKTGKQMGMEIGLGEPDGQVSRSEPVQPRKQDARNDGMSPEQYLKSIKAKITPANIRWAKGKLGSK